VSVEDGIIGVILDKTSYYYESGGQIFDTGCLILSDESRLIVENCQSYAGFVVHVGKITCGTISVGNNVNCIVDYARRSFIAPNHTMTHVLNFALKTVLLGESKDSTLSTCDQKGSLVDDEKLRFDFSWNAPLSPVQVKMVENLVVEQIKKKLQVFAEIVPLSDASKIKSVRMVFGEKYPDPVRVISVGEDVQMLIENPNDSTWNNLSIEFCGGTHLANTGQAEDFVLVEESGIAKGIRRIIGLTRELAKDARDRGSILLKRLSDMELSTGSKELYVALKAIKLEVRFSILLLLFIVLIMY
jgi:alanyl-tRNA synthetase